MEPLPRRVRRRGVLPEQPEQAQEGTESLPRRVRQASLAPQLREQGGRHALRSTWSAPPNVSPEDRDPDEVRATMASLQRGWQRGRAEADGNATGTPGGRHRTIRITDGDAADHRGDDVTGTTSEGDGP